MKTPAPPLVLAIAIVLGVVALVVGFTTDADYLARMIGSLAMVAGVLWLVQITSARPQQPPR